MSACKQWWQEEVAWPLAHSTDKFRIRFLHTDYKLDYILQDHTIYYDSYVVHTQNRFMTLFQDHLGETVPEENFWTLWCKGRLTEADTVTIRLGATPSGLTSAYLHHPPYFFTGRMPFLSPNQQCQSTEGN